MTSLVLPHLQCFKCFSLNLLMIFLFFDIILALSFFFLLVTPPLHQNWSAVDMQGGTDSFATSPKAGTAYDFDAAESIKL